MKQKRSKAIDMRYHWIRDQVKQDKLCVTWQKGTTNLADYFTKAHPVWYHKTNRSLYVNTTKRDTLEENARTRRIQSKILRNTVANNNT